MTSEPKNEGILDRRQSEACCRTAGELHMIRTRCRDNVERDQD